MGDDATNLSDLLGNGPVQPSFAPITTGGGDPFISPVAPPTSRATTSNSMPDFGAMRYSFKNLMTYLGFFLAAAVLAMSTPRALLLQYIPNTYTSGGVVSYTGAAVVGGASVILGYVITTLINVLL
jgi:hypothetical protein